MRGYAALRILFALQKHRLDVIRSRSAHHNLHHLVASSGLLDGFSFLSRDIRARLIWPVQHLDGWVFEVSLDFRAGLIASLDAVLKIHLFLSMNQNQLCNLEDLQPTSRATKGYFSRYL